jgi:hypothetical protein
VTVQVEAFPTGEPPVASGDPAGGEPPVASGDPAGGDLAGGDTAPS